MYLYVSIFDLYDISNLSAGTTSHGTRSTWSRSTPAAVSTTSITWTLWATTPPPSLGGTSCWRQTASTTSTHRKEKTRRSSRLGRCTAKSQLEHETQVSFKVFLTQRQPLQVKSESDCVWAYVRVLCLTANEALLYSSVSSWWLNKKHHHHFLITLFFKWKPFV